MYHRGMRRAVAIVLTLAVPAVVACQSPRVRACRALLLAADECDAVRGASRGVSTNPVVASRHESAARWVRSMETPDVELRKSADALAFAMERRAQAFHRLDEIAMSIRLREGAPATLRTRSVDFLWNVSLDLPVLEPCGSPISALDMRIVVRAPDCDELVNAFGYCIAAERRDSLEQYLGRCSAALDVVKSDDPARQAAIREVVQKVKAVASDAAQIEMTASEFLAMHVLPVRTDLEQTGHEADLASARLREVCSR
jgi:hypothetical protein